MSDDRRDAQHTSDGVLPSHPVDRGDSDMEASRSVSPEVRQAKAEARDPTFTANQHQGSLSSNYDSTLAGSQYKAEGSHQYGEGYTSDGIPPALNLSGLVDSAPAEATADSTVSNNHSSLQEAVPASTDHGIADNTIAGTDSPVSPSKSENRGFFSRILGGFLPGTSETPASTTPQEPPPYLTSAPSLSWGKPTDTADIEVVKDHGLEKAEETGLDPATATKLAGLDSAAAYNKDEPAVAAAEVLAESKADARQNTVSASDVGQAGARSPGRESEVYTTPQTSPDRTHSHSSEHVTGQDSTQPRGLEQTATQDSADGYSGSQASDFHESGAQNSGRSLRSTSFETKPIAGEGWGRHDAGTGESLYSGAFRQETVTPATGSSNIPHQPSLSSLSNRTADRDLDGSAVTKEEAVRGSSPTEAKSQPETVNTTGYAESEPQTQAPTDSDINQGVFSKLAAAVGLEGATEESSQTGHPGNQTGYPDTQTGYSSGQTGYSDSQTGYTGNQAGYSDSQTGYTGNQAGYTSGQTGYTSGQIDSSGSQSNSAGTGISHVRTLSNLPPSASWSTAEKFQPEAVTSENGTAAADSNTGYQAGAGTDSSLVSGGQSVDEESHAKPTLSKPAHSESTGTEPTYPGESADTTTAGSGAAGTGAAAASTAGTGNASSYTDAGKRDTPVEQSSEAFTADTAPTAQSAVQSDLESEVKPEPKIGTTAAEHATSPRQATHTPSVFKETSAEAEQAQPTEETKPHVAFGTTAAEHALRRTSGTPLSRESAESVPPTSSTKLAATPEAGAARDSRTTADLPVSTNAPPASARTTQEEAAAGRTAGLNGNAAPSTAVASQAEKSAATDASKGIGSQGNPAVPAQSAGKTANTGKHNGFLACFTCGQKSTVE